MPEVIPPLSCSHAFLLELQAVSPGHSVVQLKWHSINLIDTMEVFVGFVGQFFIDCKIIEGCPKRNFDFKFCTPV